MARTLLASLVVMLALSAPLPAADKAPAGTWKIMLQGHNFSQAPLWLVKLEEKDGAWTGKVLANSESMPKSEFLNASVRNGVLSMTMKVGDTRVNFEAKAPAEDATRILGTILLPRNVVPKEVKRTLQPAAMERTTMTGLSDADVLKETLATSTNPGAIVDAAVSLASDAGFKKAKPDEVRAWVDKGLKAAETFGERFQREVLLEIVEGLNEQDGMAQIALPYARRAERMLLPKDRPVVHERILKALQTALAKAGKEDEAKQIEAKLEKLDFGIRTQTYAGRAAKHNRVAVFELFTGTECPPCVAADLGFDALVKTFKPSEVIMLQYHEHIPGPDPLASEQTFERMKYYGEAYPGKVRGTPTTLVNGTPAALGGGLKAHAQDKYDQYYDAVTASLDEEAKMKLSLKAVRKGDKIDIEADVAESKETGKMVKLRLILVEDVVDFKGGNGIEQHHHVVRGFPGGVDGVALDKKDLKHKASVDVGELRKQTTKYITDYFKKAEEDLPKTLPLEMKKLKVVALVQDDNTRDIFHAVQVDVEEAQ